MRSSGQAVGKPAAALETSREERKAKIRPLSRASRLVDRLRHVRRPRRLLVSRIAGRWAGAWRSNKNTGACPMPLDLNRSMIFIA